MSSGGWRWLRQNRAANWRQRSKKSQAGGGGPASRAGFVVARGKESRSDRARARGHGNVAYPVRQVRIPLGKAKKGAAPADKVEALLEALACYVAETSPGGFSETPNLLQNNMTNLRTPPRSGILLLQMTDQTPVQIHIHQCPDCAKATVQTSRGELEIGVEDLERAQCDARVGRPGQSNTSTIPPKTRRQVLSRDRRGSPAARLRQHSLSGGSPHRSPIRWWEQRHKT